MQNEYRYIHTVSNSHKHWYVRNIRYVLIIISMSSQIGLTEKTAREKNTYTHKVHRSQRKVSVQCADKRLALASFRINLFMM